MAGDTKERIMETALELFPEKGHLGTSMSDIAKQLGFKRLPCISAMPASRRYSQRFVERLIAITL